MSKTSTAKRQSPLYRQVFIELRHRIERGQIAIGMPVPSEAELSEMFAASRITVRHSLRLLEADGYIRKEPARRTVVVSSKPALRDAWVFESLEDIAHQVKDARLDVKSYGRVHDDEAASQLGLEPDAGLYLLHSTLVRSSRIYAESRIFFPNAIGRQLKRRDFTDVAVFRSVQRRLGVTIASVANTVWADAVTTSDAAVLGCAAGGPLLATRLLFRDQDRIPIQVSYTRSLASDVRLTYSIATQPRGV